MNDSLGVSVPVAYIRAIAPLHALHTGEIHSKRAAVRWAELELDARFAVLAGAAWEQRYDFAKAFDSHASTEAVEATLEFARHACALGQKLVATT